MKKILIVDDYPDILEGLSYVLKDHYEVTTAGNLTEAKKEVSTTVFDVICSDYAMPDGTGLELLEFCRQEKFLPERLQWTDCHILSLLIAIIL